MTDSSGATVPNATIKAVDDATDAAYDTISSSAGDFNYTNLPLGTYTVTVTARGFSTEKFDKVSVTAGAIYTLPIKLTIASSSETIEVTADALTLDTTTDTQATILPQAVVQNLPNSGRDFTQMLAQTPGFAGYSTGGGAGNASVNGTRSNSVNWQIEGTDNNDLWWNIPAVNQGGVSAIAGVILPVDAIDNFSFETAGSTALGRNSGGTANLTIKSGTNRLHGSAYYFNHNEFFQRMNPFSTTKPASRNQNYGFSVGGPVIKDKFFFFLAFEHQNFLIGAANKATEPSAAYQAASYSLLDFYGVPHNPVANNLLYGNGTLAGLWPATALTGPASADNYQSNGNLTGHSFNGIAKIDFTLTERDHLAASWFAGQGTQTAPTSSELPYYFENAPIHVQNYSIVYNHVFSTAITNQLSAGVSYFNQVFSDANTGFNPIGLGLNTGVTDPSLPGSPHLIIGPSGANVGLSASSTGFDPLGPTAPSGRNDITGHLDEALSWTKGAHQYSFGGEFRQAQVDDFYQTGQRGTIYFDGTQGPWATGTSGTACATLATQNQGVAAPAALTSDPNIPFLADFLAGCPDPSTSEIVLGNPKRQVFVNTWDLYGADNWKVSPRLSLNYGVRYDYEGPVHSDFPNLSTFDPSLPGGLAVAGVDVPNIYNKFWGAVSPRVGFAYQPSESGKMVIRGGYGLYYDSIYMKSVLQNNGLQNISVFSPSLNPAGSDIAVQAQGQNVVVQPGQPIFQSFGDALAGQGSVKISTFAKNFRPSYTQEFDLNLQQSFTSSVVWQLGYVGTKGTHLMGMSDINAGALNSLNVAVPYGSATCAPQYSGATPTTPGNDLQCSRPYFSQFPQFSVIDQATSNLGSNYNSLQTSLRLQGYHGFTAQFAYTWSHAIDYETGLLPYLPQDPGNETAERGNSDYDVRNSFVSYVDYALPNFRGPKRLVQGWEFNSAWSFHGGTPYTVTSSSNPSGNGESADRAVQVVANPNAEPHGIGAVSPGVVQWFVPGAFVDAPTGQYSPTRRGQNYNPGYSAVDLSILKNTPIVERVTAQFRADIFNIFNRTNLAPLGFPSTGETGQIGSTIGPYLGNPGIGPGEPLNAQFALKIIF
ncbi:Oar protein [Acidisarcina polymorpha]|uniref:Oar protein n=1 Tax=Acidisarcina polymorpha TaxID=2211140 RepID=A0A2Z5G977_9BACT|nr:Oar protein [Acidisarcina polymorpha]